MNESVPMPVPAGLPPLPAAAINPEPPVRLVRLLLGLIVAVMAFDICFWKVNAMGFSVAVFISALAGVILLNREGLAWKPVTRLLIALMAGAVLAATIETGVTNTLTLIILIVVLAGVTFFSDVESFWGRVLSQGVALVRAPGRLFWLGGILMKAAFSEGIGWTGGLIGGCLLAVPALVLALIFGSLLASGNAVFGNWTGVFFDWFWKELELYLNGWRIALWCWVAFCVLPLLRPVSVSAWWWSWTERLPRLPQVMPARSALVSSGLILVMLNLLFFVANLADALFLWSGDALPKGVTYTAYVHQGVNSLITTVLLSAFVLATIFQQEIEVARRRELKLLALFWIAQNLFLLVSVALRLKLYIEAFEMTIARLGVIIFLVLVAVGFGLLTIKIVQERSLSWLIGGCLLAVFATFYITQFLDLAGWSANYNVARWEKDRTRRLDLVYLSYLGPAAWPAIRKATDEGADWPEDVKKDGGMLSSMAGIRSQEMKWPLAQFTANHWREFSLRAWMNRGAIEEHGTAK